MSGEVRPGKKIEHGYGGGTERTLEITVAIRNPNTNQWEKPELKRAEVHAINGAIETIRQIGKKAQALKEFDQENAILEMTQQGVFLKGEEGKWSNLLENQAVKDAVLKTLEVVTDVLGTKENAGNVKASQEIAANAESLQKGDVVIQVRVVSSPFAANLINQYQSNTDLTKRIGTFVKAYIENREQFEMIMRRQGISDLQSVFVFNHFVSLHESLKEWDTSFQNVLNLAKSGKQKEALDAYTAMINNQLPILLEKVRNARYAAHLLDAQPYKKALQQFLAKIPNSQGIFTDLLNVANLGARQKIFLEQCIENARKSGIEIPEETTRIFNSLPLRLEEENDALNQFNRMFLQSNRFPQFFNHRGLMQTNHPLHRQWVAILKQHGWNSKLIQDFSKLINHHAALIQRLKQAEQAIAVEIDPNKKRALNAQFKILARQLMPEINLIHQEMQKRGGLSQLRSLSAAASELNLAASHQLKTIEGLRDEAGNLIGLMEDRLAYVGKLYDDLVLVSPSLGTIARTLLQGPHAQDRVFISDLEAKGWDPAKLQKLSDWHDTYLKEIYPLRQAKKNLDDDPENIEFQRQFKNVANRQIAKLNKLSQTFKATFGEKKHLKSLEEGINIYNQRLRDSLSDLERAVRTRSNLAISNQIENIKRSLEALSSWSISEAFDQTEAFISDVSQVASEDMSWDEGFLNMLIPDSKSPLMQYNPNSKFSWPQLLNKYGVEKKDVESIINLFNQYQRQLKEIMLLERQLESHPENAVLRDNLMEELSKRFNGLLELNQKFEELSTKIGWLENAIRDMKSRLEIEIASVLEGTGNLPETDERRINARKTEEDNMRLLRIVNRLSVLQAFEQKRGIIDDLMKRFVRRAAA